MLYMAFTLYTQPKQYHEANAEALQRAIPERSPVARVNTSEMTGRVKELNISGIFHGNIFIINGKNHNTIAALIFATREDINANVISSVLLFSGSESPDELLKDVDNWMVAGAIDDVDCIAECILTANGLLRVGSTTADTLEPQLTLEGYTLADNFFYMAPFLNGREDGLQNNRSSELPIWMFVIAGLVGLLSVVDGVRGRPVMKRVVDKN